MPIIGALNRIGKVLRSCQLAHIGHMLSEIPGQHAGVFGLTTSDDWKNETGKVLDKCQVQGFGQVVYTSTEAEKT